MGHLFTIIIYQPFLNILVGIYWLLTLLHQAGSIVVNAPPADMGVAVIIFTIILRFILLPLTFSGERSEKERREIEEKVAEIEHRLNAHPIEKEREIKKVLKGNSRMVFSSLLELFIQVMIAIMLWRIFAKGLTGEDLHLIYSWMPKVHQPFNLMFWGKYDLTHPDMHLNLLQSILIFILEALNTLLSPYKVTRADVVRMQFTLPIFSFIIFAFLPAGKKLFVITALVFSIVYTLIRGIRMVFEKTFRQHTTTVVPVTTRSSELTSNPTPLSGHEETPQTHISRDTYQVR